MLIAKGDRLILYTDGLIEVFNSLDDMLGVEGLKAFDPRIGTTTNSEVEGGNPEWCDDLGHGPPPTTYLS